MLFFRVRFGFVSYGKREMDGGEGWGVCVCGGGGALITQNIAKNKTHNEVGRNHTPGGDVVGDRHRQDGETFFSIRNTTYTNILTDGIRIHPRYIMPRCRIESE